MSMYNELEALVIEKGNVTWDFVVIFEKALREKMGTDRVQIPIEKAYVENGKLCVTIVLTFKRGEKEDYIENFGHFEIGAYITATSSEVVVMKFKREKVEIEFLREGASESFTRAVDHVAELFKNEINFAL